MADLEQLVGALLVQCDHPGPVGDLLLHRAGTTDWPDEARPAPSSADVAFELTKTSGAANAIRLVKASGDPALLDRIARSDSRLGVRRAVAVNLAARRDTLQRLLRFAARSRNGDSITLEHLVARDALNCSEILAALADGGVPDSFRWRGLIGRVMEEGSRDNVIAVLGFGSGPARQIVGELAEQATPVVGLREAVESVDEQLREGLVVEILNHQLEAGIGCDVAELILRYLDGSAGSFFSWWFQTDRADRSTRFIEPDAARLLARASNPDIRQALASSSQLPTDVIEALLGDEEGRVVRAAAATVARTGNLELAEKILADGSRDRLQALIEWRGDRDAIAGRLVRQLLDGSWELEPETWARVLVRYGPGLDTETRITILGRGGINVTRDWMRATEDWGARPGELTALLDRAEALWLGGEHAVTLFQTANPETLSPTVRGELFARIDDLATLTGPVKVDPVVAEWMWEQLTDAFGDDTDAYEMLFSMYDDWDGSFPDLISAVTLTRGTND